jgi:uncharacterized protein
VNHLTAVAEKLDQWIPMSDGVRLCATLYLPDTKGPWPVILEGLPYRKDDITAYHIPEYRRLRDEGDFAVCRVDLRGTGSSEGVAEDEYARQEQLDLCEVIAWLAEEEWSNGNVGMYGASYGGFNSFQVAMERPGALKAIVPIYATDDRYTDDVHYMGGARRALDLTDYPLYMVAMNALPPVPAIAGEEWRQRWNERLETLRPWILRWLTEQRREPYWRHGSLRPDYSSIVCPTMIVAGWADGYRNATFRVLENMRAPVRLLLGPWSHMAAESSLPGPRIDLVPELIRWFNRWLRDERNGIDEEPPVAVFIRRSTRPEPDLDEVKGEWRYEREWPLERSYDMRLRLSESARHPEKVALDVRGDVGAYGAGSGAGNLPAGQPMDQRPDEAYSLTYDWAPLENELEVLGHPRLDVRLESSAPVAYLSAKLCDVFPDGASALVTRGFLNLTHRGAADIPEAVPVGEIQDVALELDATSWIFEPGHRLRLDLAGSDWPNAWPPPEPVTLTIDAQGTTLVLPVVDDAPPAESRPAFNAPPNKEPPAASSKDPPVWRLERDVLSRESRVVIEHSYDTTLEGGATMREHYAGTAGVSSKDPGHAWIRGRAMFELAWPEVTARAETRMVLTSDRSAYHLSLELDVAENDAVKKSLQWKEAYPRDLQ